MDFETFLLEMKNIGKGVSASNTYKDHEGVFCFYVQVAGKGNKGHFHKMECPVSELSTALDKFLCTIKEDSMNLFVGNKLVGELSEDDVEADVWTTINPSSGNASVGRKIGKKYPKKRLRVIVVKPKPER